MKSVREDGQAMESTPIHQCYLSASLALALPVNGGY
jgi:hypothetical protein